LSVLEFWRKELTGPVPGSVCELTQTYDLGIVDLNDGDFCIESEMPVFGLCLRLIHIILSSHWHANAFCGTQNDKLITLPDTPPNASKAIRYYNNALFIILNFSGVLLIIFFLDGVIWKIESK